jgi:hypothetical protein
VTGALAHLDLPLPIALTLDVAPDARVLAFSAAVTALAVLAFGLVPALRASRADVHAAIKAGAVAAGATRLQSALVVGQLATSLVLAASALLFVRAVRAAGATDPGSARAPCCSCRWSGCRAARATRRRRPSAPRARAARRHARRARRELADIGPLDAEVSRRGTLVEGYARQRARTWSSRSTSWGRGTSRRSACRSRAAAASATATAPARPA